MAQFFLDCSNVTFDQPKLKNQAVSISVMVCLVLTIAILCLLIFYRAYKTVLQRFFQYLTPAAANGCHTSTLAVHFY